jgi:muramoyltetrapeptide carboxypeptidase
MIVSHVGLAADRATPRGEEWVKARALRPGDTIVFVAPAGPPEKEIVEKCARRFDAMGFKVILPRNLFRRQGYLAGSDEERAAELNAAIRDPNVQAIFPCRGGYGLTRILDRIDYAAFRKQPKVLIGYSDLTALHLAMAARAKVITFHSPMPESSLWREDGDYAFADRSFGRALMAKQYRPGATGYTIELPKDRPRPVCLVRGKARGRLVGGNLSLVCATLGTPYAVSAKDNLLFLEDTGEAPYRVDRLLSQLRLAGVLEEAAGIIVGSFSRTDAAAVEKIVRDYCGRLKKPVLMSFPVGHTPWNATLPHGALAELDTDQAQVRLLENPVRLP